MCQTSSGRGDESEAIAASNVGRADAVAAGARPDGPAGAAGQPARPIRRKLQARRDTHPPRRSQAMDLNASFTQPMRDELTKVGFAELRTPDDVDTALGQASGTTLVFVNSVCGCAAGMARPGAALALSRTGARPDRLVTVFAGQDREATERARSYFSAMPPSSPSIALLKDGALVD